jgi:hypothetical protein
MFLLQKKKKERKDFYLLGYNTVEGQPKLRSNMSFPSSWQKNKPSKKPELCLLPASRRFLASLLQT